MRDIRFTKQATKSLSWMPEDMSQLVLQKLERLASGPQPVQPRTTKGKKFPGRRLHVLDWHVLHETTRDRVIVLCCNHRPWRRCIEMSVQIIEKDRRPEWAVIPYEIYQVLVEDSEMLQDIRDYEIAKKAMESDEELIPSDVINAILTGEKPIKVWRKYRGMTQQQLASAAGITKAYLSQIETGKRTGTTDVLTNLAKALGLTLDDIVP